MTIFNDREASVHDAEPIECYEFVGSYQTYRYTSSDLTVIVNGQTFVPLAMKRSNIKVGTYEDDQTQLEVELPISCSLVKDYGFQVTPPRLLLNLYRVHRGTDFATDWAIVWKGLVSNCAVTNNKAKLLIPSVFGAAMSGSIPSVYYQTPCNHVLFDFGCKIPRAANMITTTITAISGNNVELADNGGKPDGFFIGGEVADIEHNDRRMIIGHAGNNLTVNYPFSNLKIGANVEVTRGCDHGFSTDCKLKYDNQINFGGTPFIPIVNIFREGL